MREKIGVCVSRARVGGWSGWEVHVVERERAVVRFPFIIFGFVVCVFLSIAEETGGRRM